MKLASDIELIRRFQVAQRGVFTSNDLTILLAEKHPAALSRRLRALAHADVLRRFIQGYYVVPGTFDLNVLSQRIAPKSYVSFGTVLAQELVVGTMSENEIQAVKEGRSRIYRGVSRSIIHRGLQSSLIFGYEMHAGVRTATAEKALLDTLYFHLRGVRYPFDIYSDLRINKLDLTKISLHLLRYRNHKFISFVKSLLHGYQ
jgi:hypothetical protein